MIQRADVGNIQVRRYLVVPRDGEATVLQLFGRKVRQDVGNISRNIGPGRERYLLVTVASSRYFPARDVEAKGSLYSLLPAKSKRFIERHTISKGNQRTCQCRSRRMGYPKLPAGPEYLPLPHVFSPLFPRSPLPGLLQILKERTT